MNSHSNPESNFSSANNLGALHPGTIPLVSQNSSG